MDEILGYIKNEFNSKINPEQKRPGIYQLYLPLYHEDGDMIDLFLSKKNGKYILGDFGQTLMRLSYSYDLDTENKQSVLDKIISENGLKEDNGNIYIETSDKTVFSDIMHLTQAYAKIASMRYWKRSLIEKMFYEILDEFILKELVEFNPQKNVFPIPERDDISADYSFTPNGHPIYLFGVKDSFKARLVTLTCLEFQRAKLNYRGWVVNEDFEKLPKKERSRLTNTCDKQFTSFDDFKREAKGFLEREKNG